MDINYPKEQNGNFGNKRWRNWNEECDTQVISLFPLAEEIRELEDRSIKIMKYQEQREKRIKKINRAAEKRGILLKCTNIYIAEEPEGEEREKAEKRKSLKQ